jgi:hypothetical protein
MAEQNSTDILMFVIVTATLWYLDYRKRQKILRPVIKEEEEDLPPEKDSKPVTEDDDWDTLEDE